MNTFQQEEYGEHPIWLGISPGGDYAYAGIFWNSNAKSFTISPSKITWRTTGGIVDLMMIVERDVQSVIRELYRILGKPMLPPYWSLGYHLCRWGYESAQQVMDIDKEMKAANIPLEVQWVDIDYMDQEKDFTIGGYRSSGKGGVFVLY